jgi:hypothetical protein
LELLNDDGKGLGALRNTAVGYRLSNSAQIFRMMSELPADLIAVAAGTPVDMPARFNEVFVDAQLNIENRPKQTGNLILDLIRDLTHLRLVIIAVRDFVDHALDANARSIYSPATLGRYNELKKQLMKLLNDAVAKLGRSTRIIEKYSNPGNMIINNPAAPAAFKPDVTPVQAPQARPFEVLRFEQQQEKFWDWFPTAAFIGLFFIGIWSLALAGSWRGENSLREQLARWIGYICVFGLVVSTIVLLLSTWRKS